VVVRIFYIALFLIGTPLGIWLVKGGLGDVIEAAQSPGWPTTTGFITHSTLLSSTSHGRRSSTSYQPEITYTYTVSGAEHAGTVITPGRHWTFSSSREAVQLFPQGSRPTVSYSRSNAADAILQPGLHAANFTQLVLGLLALTFALPWGLAGVFAVADPSGKPGSLTFPEGSICSNIIGFLILATFIEFFLAWWLCSL
jgi:hypothetical protein